MYSLTSLPKDILRLIIRKLVSESITNISRLAICHHVWSIASEYWPNIIREQLMPTSASKGMPLDTIIHQLLPDTSGYGARGGYKGLHDPSYTVTMLVNDHLHYCTLLGEWRTSYDCVCHLMNGYIWTKTCMLSIDMGYYYIEWTAYRSDDAPGYYSATDVHRRTSTGDSDFDINDHAERSSIIRCVRDAVIKILPELEPVLRVD